jgi:hypothetical protein
MAYEVAASISDCKFLPGHGSICARMGECELKSSGARDSQLCRCVFDFFSLLIGCSIGSSPQEIVGKNRLRTFVVV